MSPHDTLSPDLLECAKRAYDAINIHLTFGKRDDYKHKWIAISLADGRADGTIYESAIDAADKQAFPNQCWYVSFLGLRPDGISVLDCAKMIELYRQAASAGIKFVDNDSRKVRGPLMTANRHDYMEGLFVEQAYNKLKSLGKIG